MASISVIVPVYKVEAYLDRCVRSILDQSFSDFELILVDDGSPDNCPALCDGYALADSRVHVIHRENGGLSAARNSGIDFVLQNSESQWIAFIDSDDWIHRDCLKVLHAAAAENHCLISACGCQRTAGEALEENQDLLVQVLSADDYYCDSFHGLMTPAACNKLYSRSLFREVRYPVGKLHEDEFTTYRLLYQAGKVAVVTAALYAYFENRESITLSRWNPKRLDVLEGMQEQIAFARERGNQRLWQKVSHGFIYSAYEHLGQAQKEYRPRIRRLLRWGLKQGRRSGSFPFHWYYLWAYEMAYPCKPLWWLVSRFQPKEESHD